MNAFIAVVLASLLARVSYQMARSPVLPQFAQDLGATPELIGVIVAASTVTGVIFKLPAGVLSDVIGRKRMMVLGGVFFALPPFLYPRIDDAAVLLVLRFIHGFATAIFSPVASAYVAGLAERGRGARLGWFSSSNDVGATAGPVLGGMLLYYTASYDAVYYAVGAIGSLALLLVLLVPEPAGQTTSDGQTLAARVGAFLQGLREVLAIRAIFVASAAEAIMYVGFGAFLGFLPIYGKTAGLNDAEIAIVLGIQLTAAVVAKPVAGWVSDRSGRKPAIVVGLLLCAIALPFIFRAESFVALIALVSVLGLGVATVTPVTNALIADVVASHRLGAGMGVFGTLWDIGEAAGPMVAGFLIGRFGYSSAFDAIAIATAVAAAGFAALVRGSRTRGDTHEQQ